MSGKSLNNPSVQPCAQTTISSEEKTADLEVTVESAIDGKTIEGVTVEISGPEKRTDTTKADGTVIFSCVMPGVYMLFASKEDYITENSAAEVLPGISNFAELVLTPVCIVAVEFLDGDDKTLSKTGKQFVNLPKDKKWTGSYVANIDRLSQKTRIRVRFNNAGSYGFKIKYKPGLSNVIYTVSEKGRNSNFKFQDGEKSYTTDGDGTKIIPTDFFVSSAGGDTYRLVAEDHKGNPPVESSQEIETHRLIYYKEIKMKGIQTANSMRAFKSEFARHKITLVSVGSVFMDHMPNISPISSVDIDKFKQKARTAYRSSNASTWQPYVVAIAYTDYLAVKDSSQKVVKAGVRVGPGQSDVWIPILDDSGNIHYLWNNIDSDDWFVSAKYLKDGDWDWFSSVDIPKADCTPMPAQAGVPDMCWAVKIKVSSLPPGTGTITLVVNWVNSMAGGMELPTGNLICICTRAWWRGVSEAEQNQVMIHEMGHKVGMVADAKDQSWFMDLFWPQKGPDRTSTYYTNKGHVGPHCNQGLTPQQKSLASYKGIIGSTCVMFGETNGIITFCNECSLAVRKQDLSKGWSAF